MGRLRRDLGFERLEPRTLLASLPVPAQSAVLWSEPSGSTQHLSAAVAVENVQGLRAAKVEIRFDAAQLQADEASIRAGEAWSGSGLAVARVDNEEGTINAFVFSLREMTETGGSLIDIDFIVAESAAAFADIDLELQHLSINDAAGAMEAFGEPHVSTSHRLPASREHDPTQPPVRSHTADRPASQPDEKFTVRPTPQTRLPLGPARAEGERVEVDAQVVAKPPSLRPSRPVPADTLPAQSFAAGERATAPSLGHAANAAVDRPAIRRDDSLVYCRPVAPAPSGLTPSPSPASLAFPAAAPFIGPVQFAHPRERPRSDFPESILLDAPAQLPQAAIVDPPGPADAPASRTFIAAVMSPLTTSTEKLLPSDPQHPQALAPARTRALPPAAMDRQDVVSRRLFADASDARDDGEDAEVSGPLYLA